ncbi:biotin synthase [Roseateles sp. BYS180W]|uniref:Biotin synthase n=1 Tax=Roseateles rivi TaxID=3299028 RepID=A0ABW7FRR7_9BURK
MHTDQPSQPSSEGGQQPSVVAAHDVLPLDEQAALHQRRRLLQSRVVPWLHEEVASRMAERLQAIKRVPAHVLNSSPALGGGHAQLLAAYPDAQHWWWEASPALRAQTELPLAPGWWARWRGASTAHWRNPASPAAELLWSNMELHWCALQGQRMKQWQEAVAVGGFVMFSTIGPDSFKELRQLWQERGWGAVAPDWVDMHDLGDAMVRAGFEDPVMDQEAIRLTWSRPEGLLRDLRALGGNTAPARSAGLRTPRWRDMVLQALEQLRGGDGRLALTLEVVYGHAFKGQPRLTVAAETAVSLEHMRSMVRRTTPR